MGLLGAQFDFFAPPTYVVRHVHFASYAASRINRIKHSSLFSTGTMALRRDVTALLVLYCSCLWTLTQAQILHDDNTCKVVTFLPFTDTRSGPRDLNEETVTYGYGTWPDAQALAKASYSLLATAQMAKQHFNARDTSIVPELGDASLQYDQCNITLDDHIFLNSGYDRAYSVSKLRELLEEEVIEGRRSNNAFCAVVGPVDALGEDGVSVITEGLNVPQLAFETINSKFSDREEYPTIGRVIPNAYDFGSTFPKFFHRDIWKREAVAVLYDNTEYGKQFMIPIENMAEPLGYEVYSQLFLRDFRESIDGALNEILERGYRTIVLVTDKIKSIEDVANEAVKMNMLGKGYFWLLANEALQPAQLNAMRYFVGSPTDRLLRGSAMFTNYDPFVYNGTSDAFLTSWKNQNASIVSELNQLLPMDTIGGQYFLANETYFESEVPTEYASFLYDAIISIGISACRTFTVNKNVSHMDQLLATAFTGASGKFRFQSDNGVYANSRDSRDVMFGIYNIRRKSVDTKGRQR